MLVTLSDRKLQISTDSYQTVAYYNPDVITAQDYSSFGVIQDGRQYGNTPRFTYNGKQLDRELNWQDYGMRESDAITGRFVSMDPLTGKFPFYSPYQYAGNNPIWYIDLDGLEPLTATIEGVKRYDNNAIKVIGAVTIKIQIINLSSAASGSMDLPSLKMGIQSGLNDLMYGSHTSTETTMFTTNKGKIVQLPNATPQDHQITYDIKTNISVSIVNSISELSGDAIPLAIVDNSNIGNQNNDIVGVGLTNQVTSVSKINAEYLTDFGKRNSKSILLALHEIAHDSGAIDIYDETGQTIVRTPNLMNSLNYAAQTLTPEQINSMWSSSIGAWQELWKKVQKDNPVIKKENKDVQKNTESFVKTGD